MTCRVGCGWVAVAAILIVVIAVGTQVIDTGECWAWLVYKHPVISFCYAGK